MKKEILGIFIAMLLIATPLTVVGNVNKIDMNLDDQLDQYNTDYSGWLLSIRHPLWRAQGFIPTVGILTRVELLLLKVGHPPQDTVITLSIRKSLNGTDITEITIEPSIIYNDRVWVEFDFPDIGVIPSEKYFMVMRSNADNKSNCYYCAFGINNPYEHGDSWGSNDTGKTWELHNNTYFEEFPWLDFCFKTYGKVNSPPNKPNIDGPTSGKAGTEYKFKISSTDPDGNEISYYIDWGDGSSSFWTRTLPSEEEYEATYVWEEEGTFEIRAKAKDSYDAESDWATLEISMPKNKAINTPFLRFLENHPHLFPLLRQLLELEV